MHCSSTGKNTSVSVPPTCTADSTTLQLDGIRTAIIKSCAKADAKARSGEAPLPHYKKALAIRGRSKGSTDRAASHLQRHPQQPGPLGDLKDGGERASERDLHHRPRPGRLRAGCGGGPLLLRCRDVIDAGLGVGGGERGNVASSLGDVRSSVSILPCLF